MSRFRTVFLFELKGYLKNKVVIGVTLFLILEIGRASCRERV